MDFFSGGDITLSHYLANSIIFRRTNEVVKSSAEHRHSKPFEWLRLDPRALGEFAEDRRGT